MKALKFLAMMVAMLAMSVSFSSCSSDDNPEPPVIEEEPKGVIGRWSDDAGILVLYFDEDGTGTWTMKRKDSYGNSTTDEFNFVYTYNESTNSLKISIRGANIISNYEVNLTGNTLMLSFYEDGEKYTYVLTR